MDLPCRDYRRRLSIHVFCYLVDEKSFTCYKCGKIFAYESYLERHIKYVCPDNTGRTWKCSYCGKAFQYPCYLKRHIRSHTGMSCIYLSQSVLHIQCVFSKIGNTIFLIFLSTYSVGKFFTIIFRHYYQELQIAIHGTLQEKHWSFLNRDFALIRIPSM